MPSIVVTARPPTAPIGRRHERTGLPSTCTVQAPHWAMPQPYLVPVMPSTSRNTHSSGVSSPTSTSCLVPLMLIEKVMIFCLHRKVEARALSVGRHSSNQTSGREATEEISVIAPPRLRGLQYGRDWAFGTVNV